MSEVAAVGFDSSLETGTPALEVRRGSAGARRLVLGKARVRIGRSSGNDLSLQDENVSRVHAEVAFEDGRWVIEDLDSANGVFVDGQRVGKAPLVGGARVTLGRCELEFLQPSPGVAPERRSALLDRFELLASAGAEVKLQLAAAMTARHVPAEGILHRQGAPVESVLFLHIGEVRVVEVNDEGAEREVGRLAPGDAYGERALLPGQAGPALVATTESVVLELPQARLHEALQSRPELGATVVSTVRNRLRTGRIVGGEAAARPDALARLPGGEVEILGEDRRIHGARKKLEQLAGEGKPSLIVGPAGTGKRTFARAYHLRGPGPNEPYLEVSLAELEPAGVETALFGAEGEAGGGASSARIGHLEMLGTGTLAIRHAERLDAHVQKKLHTYLKLGWFHRAWGQAAVRSRTRVVLLAEAESDSEVLERLVPELRETLRANLVALPPLAQRAKDIPLLADHLLQRHARRHGRSASGFTREAMERLVSYAWPGNVAELEIVLERAVIVAAAGAEISADVLFVVPPEKDVHRLNLLRSEKLRELLRRPMLFPAATMAMMALVTAVFVLTVVGATRPPGHPLSVAETNPGMLATWLVWFPLLPLSVALFGRLWCGVCPIAGFGDLAARLGRLDLPVPKLLKSTGFWGVIAAYLVVEFAEGALEIDDSPRATALFLLAVIGLAVVFTVVFERRAFCRYLCPLASWLGAYAAVAPVEIRGNKKVCQTQCGEHTCYKGTEKVPGCPMFLYPASMTSSYECLLCTNCVRSCENRGVRLNLRPPLSELWRNSHPVLTFSIFAVVLVGVMGFHQFSHITLWKSLKATVMPASPNLRRFVVFAAFMLAALAAAWLGSLLSAAASQEKTGANLARYGIAFVPLALSGHLAAMTEEVLGDGLGLIWSYLSGAPAGAIVHPAVVTLLKFLLVASGIGGALVAIVMITRKAGRDAVFARALPHLLVLLSFAAVYLWVFTAATGSPPDATPVALAAPGTPP
ncbi:MAG: sigma 54-interacting transcriptional regulator [Acidobacteriota bacterium]